MHLPTFFNYVRRSPAGGRLSQAQVDGFATILAAWDELGDSDDRKLAYIFATAWHETGGTMECVREGFAKTDAQARRVVAKRKYGQPDSRTGQVYYGRGFPQLTWYDNYDVNGRLLGLGDKLARNPDIALDPIVSARILVEGMMRGRSGKGDFTGKALEDYFNHSTDDPVGARRIVNGTDKDQLIATYHRAFLDSLRKARQVGAGATPPEPEVEEKAKPAGVPATDTVALGNAAAIAGALVVIFGSTPLGALLVMAGGVASLAGRWRLNYRTGL